MRKFRNGDLVKSELTKVSPEEKDWYGIVIWTSGEIRWLRPKQLYLIARGQKGIKS